MSDLRTRIANTLGECFAAGTFTTTQMADAVIAELGNLHEAHTYYRPDGTPVTVLEGNYPARFDAEDRCYGGASGTLQVPGKQAKWKADE